MRILGANSMYDIVKFNTETDKKTIALKSASQPASVGETVYLLPYSTQKAATCQTGTVTKVDTIGDKAYYYTLAMTTNEKTVSCPIMNANGEVLGLIQKNASDEAKEIARLKRELRDAKDAINILKKAISILDK